jgi:hypothetical protein
MNISENVNEIEKAAMLQNHDKSKYALSTMLKLPIADPQYVMYDIFYKFKAVSERNAFSLVSLIDVIKKDKFDKVTSFDRNSREAYTQEVNPSDTLAYIHNVFNQWTDIANNNNVILSPDIQKQKESIINDFKEFSQHFEDYRTFVEKYRIIEPLYIQNKHDAEEEPFFKEELNNLFKEYSNLLTVETCQLFFNNQTNFGISQENCFIPQLFERLTNSIDQVKAEIKEQKPEAIASLAAKFVISQSTTLSEITNFLVTKNIEDQIKVQVQLTSAQNISGVILFKDGSLAVRNRNGLYKEGTDINDVTQELIKSTIDYKFRKKPTIGKIFKEKYEEDQGFFNDIDVAMNTYLDNETILKNMKFDISIMADKSFEALDDAMNASVRDYKIERYAKTILSNKYKELLTAGAMESFKTLYDSKISENELQNLIGKKLASIKTSDEFEKYLEKVINQFNGFNPEALLVKLAKNNIEPLLMDNDIYVFEVKNFEDSKTLGSPSWCIARNQHHFESYTGNGKRQFFIYDFNQNEKSNESMIGITLEKTGKFNAQHLKNDDYASPTDLLKDIQKRLILKEVDQYNLDEMMKKQLGIDEPIDGVDVKIKKTIKASI